MKVTGGKNIAAGRLPIVAAAALAASLLLQAGPQAHAAQSPYRIIDQAISVDGKVSTLSALNMGSTTYIGIRSLNASLGLKTDWNKQDDTVTVTGRGRELVLNLQDGSAKLDGQVQYGLPTIVQSNTTYVPFRFLLERLGYGVGYDAKTKTIGIEQIQENDLKISTKAIQEKGERKSLLVNYPELSGYANEAAQKKINETLKKDAQLNADAARDSLDQAAADEFNSFDAAFEGTYTVTYNEKGKLSLYVDYYIYTGGAHGSTARVPYTFDLETGELLKLKDVTGGNAKYVQIINAKIQSQIKARGLPLLAPFKTIEPDREFYLKHNGVVVYFGQYEYTPYAAGMPEFEIPYGEFGIK